MADYERRVLDHYQLSTAYPLEWPPEKDLSDDSDEGTRNRNAMACCGGPNRDIQPWNGSPVIARV